MIKMGILTASDKGAQGLRKDLSSKVIEELTADVAELVAYRMVADDREILSKTMVEMMDEGVSLLFTTGGTGFSVRDNTPEATLDVIERLVPGIPEAMRAASMQITPRAMLSRAVAGICKDTLIINLPGSPKACGECLNVIMPSVVHGIEILLGQDSECAR